MFDTKIMSPITTRMSPTTKWATHGGMIEDNPTMEPRATKYNPIMMKIEATRTIITCLKTLLNDF